MSHTHLATYPQLKLRLGLWLRLTNKLRVHKTCVFISLGKREYGKNESGKNKVRETWVLVRMSVVKDK